METGAIVHARGEFDGLHIPREDVTSADGRP